MRLANATVALAIREFLWFHARSALNRRKPDVIESSHETFLEETHGTLEEGDRSGQNTRRHAETDEEAALRHQARLAGRGRSVRPGTGRMMPGRPPVVATLLGRAR